MRGTISATSGSRPGSGSGRGRGSRSGAAMTMGTVAQNSSELGDTMVMAKYLLLAPHLNNSFFLSLAGGVKLPTGKTDLKDVYGNYLPWNIQTGTGSYDGIVEVAVTKRLGMVRLDGGVRTFITGEGDRNFKKGNSHIATVSATARINRMFDTSLSTTYRIMEKNSLNNTLLNTTGGKFLYLAPTVALKVGRKAQLSVGLSYLLSATTNGIMPVENYSVDSKLMFMF